MHAHTSKLLHNIPLLSYSIPCLTHPYSISCASILCCFTFITSLTYISTTGIGLTLNSVNYTNNSVVNITDIGTGSAALRCTTTFRVCCFSGPLPGTHWYFPNGSWVKNTNTLPYYRSRIDGKSSPEPGTVLLHHNPEGTTTGIFRCEILDAIGDFKSIYVGIYTATTGESYILKSNMFL